MQVFFGAETLEPEWKHSVVCIGTFDGVHLGHGAVIGSAVSRAAELGLPTVLATFDRNPAAVLAPDRCPPSIASLRSNLDEFRLLGIQIAVVLRFDREFSEVSADDFFQNILVDRLGAQAIVVGHDFTFGKNRVGNPEWLASRVETDIVEPFLIDGQRVSSSRIRTAVSEGEMGVAASLLGRPFEIAGIVVSGQRLGRTIGFPTLNLARSFRQVTPADGIYAGSCETPMGTFKAAVSVGARPTVDDERTIEAYLIDYPGSEIYGAAVRLKLIERLRTVAKFDSLEALQAQIASDIEHVSRVL